MTPTSGSPHPVDVIEAGEEWATRCAMRGLGRLGAEKVTRALLDTPEREKNPVLVCDGRERIGPSGIHSSSMRYTIESRRQSRRGHLRVRRVRQILITRDRHYAL